MNGSVTTDKTKRKDLSKLEKEMTKIEQPQYPNMDCSSMGRLSQTQYLASVIKVNILQTRISGQREMNLGWGPTVGIVRPSDYQ